MQSRTNPPTQEIISTAERVLGETSGKRVSLDAGEILQDGIRSLLRLLDFEGGTFDHALKEGVYGRMHFPTCRYVYRMPEHIPLRMEAAYRDELVKGCSEAKDEKLFSCAVAEACVYWMIHWYQMDSLIKSLENDVFIVAATSRQRHLLRSQIVAQTTEEAGHMEAIGATIGKMATKMRTLWPEAANIPAYPAFR
jgi:hypothetical protein